MLILAKFLAGLAIAIMAVVGCAVILAKLAEMYMDRHGR